ncbi:MAG TPA: hypothetical protein VF916_06110, partial [Ktedonobacterales bacterium]
ITGNTDTLTQFLADPVEMQLLHMITSDPARTPTFTMFADPNYFLFAGAPNCTAPCLTQNPAFAWNHGDVNPEITTTWLGMVGPGVRQIGVDGDVWSDHTDIRPTILTLLGLKDDYAHDGRTLFEVMDHSVLPPAVQAHSGLLIALSQAYKQIEAPVGQLGLASLKISTTALESGNASDDSTYTSLENQLASITSQRDALAAQISAILEGATFNGQAVDPSSTARLIGQANNLLDHMNTLAGA